MPNRSSFKTDAEYRKYWREYRKKNRKRLREYERERWRTKRSPNAKKSLKG